MSKIVKVTQSDLERIVSRVIKEQEEKDSQTLWKDNEGNIYKSSCIKSNNDLTKFLNFAGGSYVNTTKVLRDLGLSMGRVKYNPLEVNTDWNTIDNKTDDASRGKIKTANFVMKAFNDGLKGVAISNIDSESIKNLPIINSNGQNYTDEVLKVMPNYFDVLDKIVNKQKRLLGCS